MVLPNAVDAQIFARIALAGESTVLEQADRGGVAGNARRLHAMQPQRAEREGQECAHGRGHVAAASIGPADPISEAPRLGDAAAHIGQRQAAQQHLVAAAEDEEGIGLVVALVLGVTAQAPAERRAREIVGRPGRLPGGEEGPAGVAQRRPFGIIAGAWRPRLSAIAAALSSPAGPSAANAGGLRRINSRPAARALSTVTASTLAMISSIASGRPWAKICRASCSARALELSSAISRPAFICALARSTSLASRSSAAAPSWSTTTRISSEASAASVPA